MRLSIEQKWPKLNLEKTWFKDMTEQQLKEYFRSYYPSGSGPLGASQAICQLILSLAILRGIDITEWDEPDEVLKETRGQLERTLRFERVDGAFVIKAGRWVTVKTVTVEGNLRIYVEDHEQNIAIAVPYTVGKHEKLIKETTRVNAIRLKFGYTPKTHP